MSPESAFRRWPTQTIRFGGKPQIDPHLGGYHTSRVTLRSAPHASHLSPLPHASHARWFGSHLRGRILEREEEITRLEARSSKGTGRTGRLRGRHAQVEETRGVNDCIPFDGVFVQPFYVWTKMELLENALRTSCLPMVTPCFRLSIFRFWPTRELSDVVSIFERRKDTALLGDDGDSI